MIGLDTNVIVRFLVDDDPVQTKRAKRVVSALSAENPAFIATVALAETSWVLRRSYRVPTERATNLLEALVAAPEIRVEHPARVREALRLSRQGYDLADVLIAFASTAAGATETLTFDTKASSIPGMRQI